MIISHISTATRRKLLKYLLDISGSYYCIGSPGTSIVDHQLRHDTLSLSTRDELMMMAFQTVSAAFEPGLGNTHFLVDVSRALGRQGIRLPFPHEMPSDHSLSTVVWRTYELRKKIMSDPDWVG